MLWLHRLGLIMILPCLALSHLGGRRRRRTLGNRAINRLTSLTSNTNPIDLLVTMAHADQGHRGRHGESVNKTCFRANEWYNNFAKQDPWKKFSQGFQDSILASLFQADALGTENKFYVEFGFSQAGYDAKGTGPNTQLLHEHNWTGLLMDGGQDVPKDNLRKEFITPENVAGLFKKYNVPLEPDYVSIDIDSCDLQVFVALTKSYRPRVMSVEYNSNYAFGESMVNVCVNAEGKRYTWKGDNMYGASLAALQKAAAQAGYTVVYVERSLDVFLVRKDLVCEGQEVDMEHFRPLTGLALHHPASSGARAIWTRSYP